MEPIPPAEPISGVDRALLDCSLVLRQDSERLAVGAFRDHALDAIEALIPFDSAMVGIGCIVDRQPRVLENHPRRIDPGFVAALNRWSHLDPSTLQAFDRPWATVRRTADEMPATFRQAALDPWRIDSGLITIMIDPRSGVMSFLTLNRLAGSPRFTERDRERKEALMPHWHAAVSANRIARALDALDAGLRSSYSVLVARPDGAIVAAQSGAVEKLRREWPDWTGGVLPSPVVEAIGRAAGGAPILVPLTPNLMARIAAGSDEVLLRLRDPNRIDRLGSRERAVAQAYGEGRTYKEIARLFDTSPSTVSNQLSSIYAKLGVRGKAELVRLLQQLD